MEETFNPKNQQTNIKNMDFSKLLQHCRDEHGVEVDISKLTEKLLWATFEYFSEYHGKTLLHTEQWDIIEQLQKRPNPSNPPPIVAEVKQRAFENIKSGEEMESASWYAQSGVLLSNREALELVEGCERANVPEPAIYPRPEWENLDKKFIYVAADASCDVYAFAEKPQFKGGLWQDGGESEYLQEVSFGKMLWQRPGHGEKEGAE